MYTHIQGIYNTVVLDDLEVTLQLGYMEDA